VRFLRTGALVVAALYAGLCLLVFALQRKLLYFPDRYADQAALDAAARLGLAPWRDGEGALVGWRAPLTGRPRARLVVLHGNAGSALDRTPYAAALAPLGIEVWLLEYPGYGSRTGAPSLPSLSEAAVRAVRALAGLGPEPVLLLGESLGCGVAGRATALAPGSVRGVLLVTPYARMSEVAAIHYPFLPGFLLRDRYAPADDLAGFEGPVALVLAGRDEVVTVGQGRRLYEALRGPRRLWVQEQATHNGLDLEPGLPLWAEAVDFLLGPETKP
jgi:pimeloyl-ACP methyl ester carboxylesterase